MQFGLIFMSLEQSKLPSWRWGISWGMEPGGVQIGMTLMSNGVSLRTSSFEGFLSLKWKTDLRSDGGIDSGCGLDWINRRTDAGPGQGPVVYSLFIHFGPGENEWCVPLLNVAACHFNIKIMRRLFSYYPALQKFRGPSWTLAAWYILDLGAW